MDEEEFRRQLDAAMRPQPAIEQARGILMYRLSLPPARAFAELVRAAETHRVPLPVLAEALVRVVGGEGHLVDKRVRAAISSQWRELQATTEPPRNLTRLSLLPFGSVSVDRWYEDDRMAGPHITAPLHRCQR